MVVSMETTDRMLEALLSIVDDNERAAWFARFLGSRPEEQHEDIREFWEMARDMIPGRKTQLINGFLPAGTPCPLGSECVCGKGESNPGRFSCAMLRMFAGTNKGKKVIEHVTSDDPAFDLRPLSPSTPVSGYEPISTREKATLVEVLDEVLENAGLNPRDPSVPELRALNLLRAEVEAARTVEVPDAAKAALPKLGENGDE